MFEGNSAGDATAVYVDASSIVFNATNSNHAGADGAVYLVADANLDAFLTTAVLDDNDVGTGVVLILDSQVLSLQAFDVTARRNNGAAILVNTLREVSSSKKEYLRTMWEKKLVLR